MNHLSNDILSRFYTAILQCASQATSCEHNNNILAAASVRRPLHVGVPIYLYNIVSNVEVTLFFLNVRQSYLYVSVRVPCARFT